MKKYPKDYKSMVILFSCKHNLNKEEFEEVIKYAMQLKVLSPLYLRNFISKTFVLDKFRFNNNLNEDIYVYNFLMYGDKLKNADLFKSYYDLYLRDIKNITVFLDWKS